MASKYLRTSDLAKAAGVHPNLVRLYEVWGYLPPIPRSDTGYRLFTVVHLEQMRLARLALQWPYPGRKEVLVDLVKSAANDDLGMAMELAYQSLAYVRVERTYAEAAIEFLERWALGQVFDTTQRQFHISEAAEWLGVTADMLRNWERDGLIRIPRDPEYSLMAILRMLLQFDAGKRDNLRQVLDTPREDEDIQWVADRLLSTLGEQEERAQKIIRQISHMIELSQNSK